MYTIHNHYIRTILRAVEVAGQDTRTLLQDTGISPEIYRETNGWVHVDQWVSLAQRSWRLLDDEYWGLSGTRCKPGFFALMVRYVQHCETVESLLREICRFYNTTREDLVLSVSEEGDRLAFAIELSDDRFDTEHYLLEFMLVVMHRLICWITDTRVRVDYADFAYPEPAHSQLYNQIFHCQHRFDQPRSAFVFNRRYLSRPLVRSSEEIKVFLKNAPVDLMTRPGSDNSTSTRIKGILLESHRRGSGFLDLGSIAEQLNISPQTLRRKLRREDKSYQQIKDNLRRDIAIDKLVREELTVADIAGQLGFAEAASFTRAFKHWTGVSPAEYRSGATDPGPGPQANK